MRVDGDRPGRAPGGALPIGASGAAVPGERTGRRPRRWRPRRPTADALVSFLLLVAAACGGEEALRLVGSEEARSPATVRAARRAYDGAPPAIPHEPFGITCTECHDLEGMEVPGVGFAPPSPHEETAGMSAISRCRQCHVFSTTDDVFVASDFVPLRQDLRAGERLAPLAPPTIPHRTFMRENCAACHTGPAAREEIRTTHPERTRCRQCHVPVQTRQEFSGRAAPPGEAESPPGR